MSDSFGVALTKELCPVCLKEMTGPIIMNTVITEAEAKKVKKLHQEVIGLAPEPCEDCKQKFEDYGFALIIVDKEKTEDMSNPYRTGEVAWIKKETQFAKDMIKQYKSNVLFMDIKDAENLGIKQINK